MSDSVEQGQGDEQDRFYSFLDQFPGLILVVGHDGRVNRLNAAARILMGDIVGRLFPLKPPSDDPDSHNPPDFDWEHAGRIYRMHQILQDNADGTVLRIYFGLDTTEGRNARRLATKYARQLSAILENAQEGVVITAGRRLIYVNPFMERLTGYDGASLRSRPFSDFLHVDDREAVLEAHRRRLTGEAVPSELVFRIVTQSGDVRWVRTSSARIEWDDAPAALSLLFDITAERQAQIALSELIRNQEAIIASRTSSLREAKETLELEIKDRELARRDLVAANERLSREIEDHERTAKKLRTAQKKASQSSQAKSVFLANMSHEIRTPLNVILGMADMALRPDSQGHFDHIRALEMIREAGTSLRGLLGDLLDLSRIEAGRLDLEAVPFNPRRMLTLVLDSHAILASRQGLALSGEVAGNVPEILIGDSGRLGQIIGNLVSNALKFTQAGKVDVAVRRIPTRGKTVDPEAVTLQFSVRDTGVGIAPEKKRAIFQSFRQADESINRRFGGSGLGLAICRRLVGLLGGRIRVASQPGQGSEFSFTARFTLPDGAATVATLPEKAETSCALPPLEILLAEDSDLSAEMILAFLAPKGHHVTRVINGHEALSALAMRRFDLILMDIQMPGMDGITATRAIREGQVPELDPNIPIVALTAHGATKDRDRILRAGVTDYLSKPLNLDRLLETLASIVGRQSALPRPQVLAQTANSEQGLSEVFDAGREEALENLGGDEELYNRLTAVYVRDTPIDRERLKRALAAGDKENTVLLAHTLKGNSGVIGASLACTRARDLEMAARGDRRQELSTLAEALYAEIDRVLVGFAAKGVIAAKP
jgi:PAS domain S-box-containing protein